MKTKPFFGALFLALAAAAGATAQDQVIPPGEKEPMLRLEAGGPTSLVTGLAFNANGTRLYATGKDKVVRVWSLDANSGRFVPDPAAAFRVPIGPGGFGMINALALSPDDGWVAIGGKGVIRAGSGFRQHGWVFPTVGAMSDD